MMDCFRKHEDGSIGYYEGRHCMAVRVEGEWTDDGDRIPEGYARAFERLYLRAEAAGEIRAPLAGPGHPYPGDDWHREVAREGGAS